MDEIYIEQLLSMNKEFEQRLNDEENKGFLAGTYALGSYWRPSVRAVQKKAASFVRDRLELDEIYAQLAEEAAELAHAALKMRRVINRKNPTPVDADDAFESVVEEANVPQEDFGECSEEIYTTEPLSGNVVLMDGNLSRAAYAYDWSIPSKTTYRSVQGYYKAAGSSIGFTANVKPTNHTTNVGIIQPDGTRRYVAGSGLFAHTFSIQQTGTHYIYAENPSSGEVNILLTVQY